MQAVTDERRANLLRKELAWLRRGAPARTSKPKFRIEAASALVAHEPPPRDSVELVATDSSVAVAVDDDAIVPLVGFVGSAPETTRLTPADAAVAVVGLVLPSSDAAAGDELQAVVDLADRIPVVGTTPDKQGDVATALVRAR